MGRKTIFYGGQCHRRVVSAEHFVRCTFPFRGMFLSRGMPPHFNSRANWLQKGDAQRMGTWRLCGAQASRMVKSPRSSRTWH
jgi:hypothetical protein